MSVETRKTCDKCAMPILKEDDSSGLYKFKGERNVVHAVHDTSPTMFDLCCVCTELTLRFIASGK